MALGIIADPNGLSQGSILVVADLAFISSAGRATTLDSTALLPVVLDNEWIEIRNAVDTVNNGLYRVNDAAPTTSKIILEKVSGADPTDATDTIDTIEVLSNVDTNVADLVFENQALRVVDLTSVGNNLPAMEVGERLDVRNQADGDNNGTYEVNFVNVSLADYTCTKLDESTPEPNDAASDDSDVRTEFKNLMWDTAGLGVFVLEDTTGFGFLDLDGVLGQAFYSKAVIDWKDDNFLIANAPFPMLTIDADAGKYLIGQDPSGNNSGWVPKDDADVTGSYALRTRKMFRNMGWSEISSAGTIDAQYAGVRTLGAFLDETAGTGDLAYYQFGTDTTVDDTVDFAFNGPVNEAVLAFNEIGNPTDFEFVVGAPDDSLTQSAGDFIADGFKVGGSITIRDATTPANDGTYIIKTVATLTLTFEATVFDTFEVDPLAQVSVDNRTAITLRLRVRTTSGNTNARTFSQADLASAGETTLSNRLFTFGLSNSQDLDISVTDGVLTTTSPWQDMSITYYATGQPQGDGGGGGDGFLVGGPYNFGIVVDGATGTNTEVYEFVQWSLRQATDIDADADTAIGKTMDGLMRFVGPTLEVGSTDGGLSFPRNPDGGGSGVYIINLAAASSNDTVYFDNTGTSRSAPLTVSVTLDFNSTLIDDTVAEYTLFFDFTRTRASDDLIVTLVSGPTGTFDSATSDLSALDTGAGQYVRVTGLTGVDEAMNGIYQVTTETSTAQWDVERYDGADIVTTAGTDTVAIDEYPIDSPDAIIVQDDGPSDVTGLASADFNFSFDYSNNAQGGRTPGSDADVQCRAIGQATAQYTQSSVATISTTAITIPVTSQIERNFLNP
jgi:hypothetical protein